MSRDFNEFERFLEETLKPMVTVPYQRCKEGIKDFRHGLDMRTDIEKNSENIIYKIEVPGFAKEDISIELEDNRLIVCAEKTTETESTNEVLHRERTTSKICRMFPLKDEVTESEIKAKFENGLLIITVPNKEETVTKKTKINIE